jgi:hypothetical protein
MPLPLPYFKVNIYPFRLNIFRLFVILSLTQLYRYTPEIFLLSTATFKYTYRAPSDKLDKNSQRTFLNQFKPDRKWLYPFHWLEFLISHLLKISVIGLLKISVNETDTTTSGPV